jgi:thiamine kinase-like enzyme
MKLNSPPSTKQAGLRSAVEELINRAIGQPLKVRSLRHRASPFATVFPTEILSICLEGGERLSLFLKHIGSEQLDHPDKQCRDREFRIYEELLKDSDLPVVRYYGYRWNDATRRGELFLECIADSKLEWQEIEHWFTAARRLAHLHAHFAERVEELLTCGFLLRFDADYLCEWAERAFVAVANQSTELAAKLKPVVDHYDRVSDAITRHPLTLVHNDLAAQNVMVDTSRRPARICFVDWEMAGVGCGLLDLAHLKYGLDPVSNQTMCAAYCDGLRESGVKPPSLVELTYQLAACELHKTLYRIARSESRQVPIQSVTRWVTDVQELWPQL